MSAPASEAGLRPLPPAARVLEALRSAWRRRALIEGAAAALALLAGTSALLLLADLLLDLPAGARLPLTALPVLLAGAALARALRAGWPGPGERRLALLAEERDPTLLHLLSTALTPPPDGVVGRLFAARAERRLAGVDGGALAPRARREPLAAAGGALLLLAVLALASGGPGELWRSWLRPADHAPLATAPAGPLRDVAHRATGRGGSGGLDALRWRIQPPAYSGLPGTRGAGEGPIAALAGSRVVVEGRLPEENLELAASLIGADGLALAREGRDWRAAFRLLPAARALQIEVLAGGEVVARRVLPLAAEPDRPPVVELGEPDRDLVLASGSGRVTFRARAVDDVGVPELELGWIRSSGSGESFSFREGSWSWDRTERGERELRGHVVVELETLGLGPGDVLHVRAVARDANDVTGPGIGVSPTRTLRVAREEELAEVNTPIGFPIEQEANPVLSQRMLIVLTERLLERAPRLARPELLSRSERLADEQARLRGRVGEVIFSRSTGGVQEPEGFGPPGRAGERPAADGHAHDQEDGRAADFDPLDPEEVLEAASEATGRGEPEGHVHDEAPILAVNQPLLDAYNAMFEAERELRQGNPGAALPHQHRALEILQLLREGDRVFARGRQTVAPIDVAAARGTGEREGIAPAPRSASRGARSDDVVLGTLESAAASLAAEPASAALELSSLAARLLSDPAVDARVGTLVARAGQAAARGDGDEARGLLARARGLLAPATPEGAAAPLPAVADVLAAEYFRRLGRGEEAAGVGAAPRPFVFATARYRSGNWDSAPLVGANLIHSLALYTDLPVAPEAVVVDLGAPELFEHPFLFLTGHLPVRFDEAESLNLKAFVERGGFVFMDDHNHDIDGAFHRTAVAELARIFGEDALRPLPDDHELYRAFFVFEDGPPITSHELSGWGDGLIHEQLYAIEVGGRIGVLYSNKDYSSEWSYHAVNKRFLAVDNTRFGVNIIVYALTR